MGYLPHARWGCTNNYIMAIHSATQIYIAGNPIPAFQEFSLSQ